MPVIDNDALIRDRAYEIWERAGRPLGLEHEHWAKARQEIETQQTMFEIADVPSKALAKADDGGMAFEPVEAKRLRQALYAPEPFSFELFGKECPRVDLPIVLRSRETRINETRVAA